jgi:hypothetical protein
MALLGILQELGRLEELTADLYPYRFVITPLLIAGLAAVLFFAYRRGAHEVMLRHRLATTLIGVPALVITLVLGNYLLSPLWERSHLEEASPIAVEAAASDPSPSATPQSSGGAPQGQAPAAFEAKVLQSGDFVGADDFHFGRGDALLIQTGPSSYVLRFENFSVRNGPDLYVYLSEDAAGKDVQEPLNLGKLKATDGAFNYDVPPEVDISRVRSAVVWCRQFSTLFATATFAPAN